MCVLENTFLGPNLVHKPVMSLRPNEISIASGLLLPSVSRWFGSPLRLTGWFTRWVGWVKGVAGLCKGEQDLAFDRKFRQKQYFFMVDDGRMNKGIYWG